MRSYTIVKALALLFGAVSAVARSLPERRSDISDADAARGYRSGNLGHSNLEDAGDTGAEDDTAISNVTPVLSTLTTDLDDIKQQLQHFVKISEAVLNGKVYTSTYSIPVDPSFPKRDTTIPKRSVNLAGDRCYTSCSKPPNGPDPDDCAALYDYIYSLGGQFDVDPGQIVFHQHGSCGSLFVNYTADTVTYDYSDFAGTTKYLNGYCIIRNQTTYGLCKFGDLNTRVQNAAYIAVFHS